jgi:hypothetical protein
LPYPEIVQVLIAGFKNRMLRFVSLGILREATGKRRNKLFIAHELMEILTAPYTHRF